MGGANSTSSQKDMAAQLAAMLRGEAEGDWKAWSELHGKLVEASTAVAAADPKTAVEALLKIAKDQSSSQALMRTFEERVSNANPDLLKGLVLLVADELNMTPLCDSEPLQMVDEEGNFCEGNVDRIINCSAELSAPNTPYAVVSIVGPQSSGKSSLLNCLFGTKFPVKNDMLGWSPTTRGIMMSRCIGPSLLLLDVEGFDVGERGKDTSFEKQVTSFLLALSDLVIINVPVHHIGRQHGAATSLFGIILEERRKLHSEGLTKILVVIRYCFGEAQLDYLKIQVRDSFEQIWESMNKQSLKFTDYIEVDIFGLPDENSRKFPKEVAALRKLLSKNRSAKVPASDFLVDSRIFWDDAGLNDVDYVAARLATRLQPQGEKGSEAWSQLHGKLADAAVTISGGNTTTAVEALLEVAKNSDPAEYWIRTFEELVLPRANPDFLKKLVLVVADKFNMTPLADSEPLPMVDEDSHFCEVNVDRIIMSSDPNATYPVVSIIGSQGSGKSYLLNCLFGTKFPVIEPGDERIGSRIMISRCIWPTLLLLDCQGYDSGYDRSDIRELTPFHMQPTLFALDVSDLLMVNIKICDIGRFRGTAAILFRRIFQESIKLHSERFKKILFILRGWDEEIPLIILRSHVLEYMEKIWVSVNGEYVKFMDYIEVNIVGLPEKGSQKFPEEVVTLRKLLSERISAKVPTSSFLVNSRIFWDAAALKDVAARLADRLKFHGEKGSRKWSLIHGMLAEAAAGLAVGDRIMNVKAVLVEVAKAVSSSEALMRTFEEGVSKANRDLLKELVQFFAHGWNMTPLANSEPVCIIDEESEFCEGNVDRIIRCSVELSAPNASYAVISIIGGQGSGKSYLLNRLFGTNFPEVDPGHTRSQRGIMMSRCILPSLLLLDFEGFRRLRKGKDTAFQKQTTLFALIVSDLMIVNMLVSDIGVEQAVSTLLLRIMFQERIKLPQGCTKLLVVVRFYDGEPPMETLRSSVQKSLEKIWGSVHAEYVKFNDYIEVNIVGLPDKNSPKFPNEVTLLRKLLSKRRSAKVPACSFSLSSSLLWVTIQQNKKLDLHQFYPGESSFRSESTITSGSSSGNAEPSSSNHSNNNLSAVGPRAMTFQELQRITDEFSEKHLLGEGGFGKVYKGVFDNGKVVAVKKLHNNPGLVERQFQAELLNLMAVRHKNIIRLVGYSSEAQQIVIENEGKNSLVYQEQRALCLDYMEGGTLEKLLSDKSCVLNWEACYKIIEGICHGLKHLHTGSKDPIYHLDLKPANILLDKDGTPKIGDFGLSRLLASTGTFVTQNNSGTPGYMPPEYIVVHEVSQKFDVFSLGVIMIEVMAGKNAYNSYKSDFIPSQQFIDQVTANWRKRVTTEALLEIEKCIKMALRCVEDNRVNRPTITEVVEELNMIDPPGVLPC